MELRKTWLIRFSRKTGKIDTTLSGLGNAMLRLWAMQNTTKTKDSIIFDDTGRVLYYFEGTADFPKITDNVKSGEYEHLDDYCEGLFDELLRINNEEV